MDFAGNAGAFILAIVAEPYALRALQTSRGCGTRDSQMHSGLISTGVHLGDAAGRASRRPRTLPGPQKRHIRRRACPHGLQRQSRGESLRAGGPEVPQVPAMLTARRVMGGTCAQPSIKGLRDIFSEISRPLTKRAAYRVPSRGVGVSVQGCVRVLFCPEAHWVETQLACTEATALGGSRPSPRARRQGCVEEIGALIAETL
jgi:hypothetical protein